MKKISRFFKEPLHFPSTKEKWIITSFVTLWVFLILQTLQPFGLNFAIHKLAITTACTIAVFCICLLSLHGIPYLFKGYYSAQNWTNGKFFLLCFNIIIIYTILATCFLSDYFDNLEGFMYYTEMSLPQRFYLFFKACIFVGIFPMFIIYYILARKTIIDIEAQTPPTHNIRHEKDADIIELSGNTKDYVKLSPEDFLYAKVSGNYVAIYYREDNCVKHKFLRISLNQLSDALQEYPNIIRCHRAFIVNMSKVVRVSGNLKGYDLELENISAKIPVSKSYTRTVKEKITQLGLPF